MDGASVPVAAVNKNSEAMRGKHKVGLAGEFEIASPADDVVRAENRDEPQLGVLVAGAADSGHEFTAR